MKLGPAVGTGDCGPPQPDPKAVRARPPDLVVDPIYVPTTVRVDTPRAVSVKPRGPSVRP